MIEPLLTRDKDSFVFLTFFIFGACGCGEAGIGPLKISVFRQ